MYRFFLFCLLAVFLTTCNIPKATETTVNTVPKMAQEPRLDLPTFSFLTAEENAFVASEVARLSLKQKAGQMTQLAMDMFFEGNLYELTKPYKWSEKKLANRFDEYQIGSVLNHPSNSYPYPVEWYELMQKLQKRSLKNTGVPILYGIDAIHGPNYLSGSTLYAQPLGVAASFNEPLTEQLAAMTAYELKAASIPWNFSPAMDVGRNPVWSRTWESFGEDIFLNKTMGAAMVRGYQGDDVGADDKVMACLKHFTGYGYNKTGRDRSPAFIPERQLREYYLPQYQNAIDQGALTIMINSGSINGIPTHANKWLLTDVLRGEMGFEGLLVSDWEDVIFLNTRYKIAPDLKEATRLAIEAGMDMSMTPVTVDFPKHVVELVQEGSISEARINLSVARILAIKVKLGLYEKNVWNPGDYPKYGGEEFAALARQSSEEAIVLLKNEGSQLPVKAGQTLFVTGPTADTQRSLNGGWTYSWQGTSADEYLGDKFPTILQSIQGTFDGRVQYAPGITYDKAGKVQQALELARKSDVIVACMGELSYTEIVGNIDDLSLPQAQNDYFKELVALGKPIVLVVAGGRPRIITDMVAAAAAVLYLPYPGPQGGAALASILEGSVNPSGRLPLTYPRSQNALLAYDYRNVETVQDGVNPLFPFGHGLSYTDFSYNNLSLSSPTMAAGETLTVTVNVKNTGDRAGKHAVLLYSTDEYASIAPSNRRLRAFQKVSLAAGASTTVSFTLRPEDLSFIGLDNKPVTEAGNFKLMIGDQEVGFTYQAKK